MNVEWMIVALCGAVPAFLIGWCQGVKSAHYWYHTRFGDVLAQHEARVRK